MKLSALVISDWAVVLLLLLLLLLVLLMIVALIALSIRELVALVVGTERICADPLRFLFA